MTALLDTRILLIVGIFLIDMWTPVGTPTWILYLVPLFFLRSHPFPHYPLILAGTCTVLIFVAYVFSPQDPSGISSLTHRALVVIAIWVAALWQEKTAQEPDE